MNWSTALLSEVAPSKPLRNESVNMEQEVWQLNLNQIELNTGRLIEREIQPFSKSGTSTHWFDDRFVLYSKLRPYLNKVLLPDQKGLGTTELVPMLPNEKRLERKFLAYYLRSKEFVNWVSAQTAGAKMPRVSMKIFWAHKIPLPPLEEQKKIADILDAADSLRQKDQQLVEHYDRLSQSLFLDMFGDPVRNSMGWEIHEFGFFINVLTDYHANGSYEVLRENVELKRTKNYALMVRTTDLEKNNFDNDVVYISKSAYEFLNKSKVFGGDIIVSKIGSAGKVFLMPTLDIPVSLGMNAFLLRFSEKLNSLFIYYLLTSKLGEREIGKRIKGAVTKTIRKDALREIPIIVPPIKLQTEFSNRIKEIEKQKELAQQSLKKSNDLFNSLLQRAFKGQL